VGNWLYGVARQTAFKARATRAKRRERERPVMEVPEPVATQEDLWNDLQPLLDQEVSRLPEKYRTVIVLCELEGKVLRDAARQLGCPEGTVASRLARARAILAKRLSRYRLVAITAATLSATLSQASASVCVPASVLSSTIKAVTLVAAGQAATTGVLSSAVAALTEGVLKAMFLNKLVKVVAVLLVAVVVVGSGALLYRTQAAEPREQGAQAAPTQPEAGAPALMVPVLKPLKVPRELLEKRLDAARKVYRQNMAYLKAGRGQLSELFGWSERWLEADLALKGKQAERVHVLREHLDRTREVEKIMVAYVNAGQVRQADADAATYYRLEAEIRLYNEGAEPHPAKANKEKPDDK
jgi:hypothetical protein